MDTPLDTFRPSTRGWLRGTLAGWGTILLVPAGLALAVANPWDLGRWPLLLTAAAFVIVALRWLLNMAALYEFTEERLIIRRGILFRSIDEIELYRVKDCPIHFTLWNQWADIGTIIVSSSDETTRGGGLVLRNIGRARERREHLRRLVDTARQRRQVREIDMVHEGFGS